MFEISTVILFNTVISYFSCSSAKREALVWVLQKSLSMTVHEQLYLAGELVCRGSFTTNARPGESSLKEPSSGTPYNRTQVNDMTRPGHG